MSELKVNTINPSSGTVLNTNALDFVLGNSGQSNTLIVSSATNENLATVDGSFRIYTTDGTVKSTYGYKSSGPSESLGTVSAHNLNLITNNLTRLTVQSGGDVVIPGGGRLGVGMNPAVVGQVISSSYAWDGITRNSIYNSSTGVGALAAYHVNNNYCNGYFGLYGTGHSTYPSTLAVESDTSAAGGIVIRSSHPTAPIRFLTSNSAYERMRIDATGNVGIGTNSPNATLQIDGADGTLQGLFVNQNGTDVDTLAGTLSQMWTRAPVHLKMAGTSTTRLLLGGVTGGAAGIQSSNANGAGSLPLVIQPFGGSVGIGTTGPVAKLDVVGSIKSDTALVLGGATFAAPSGTAPLYGVRAWVRFTYHTVNGTSTQAQGNVSGVTRNGVGDYTISFATPLPANYAVAGAGNENNGGNTGGGGGVYQVAINLWSNAAAGTTSCRITLANIDSNNTTDPEVCSLMFVG